MVTAAALGAWLLAAPAAAEPTAADRQRAASAFDAALIKFNNAEFAEAARGFFEADRLAPNLTAITNAITAARRASDHLLVARAAERAIARGEAVVAAREALAEAATRLARLELSCDAAPCAIDLDGAPVEGGSYVLPGTHLVAARGPGGAVAEERVIAMAGATYRLALHPVAGPAPRPVEPIEPARSGLPRAVFFTGLGASALLVGITAWSGADALSSKHALPAAPTQAQEDAVLARARRTDFLLAGAAVAAVVTTVIGARFTSWGGRVSAGVAPVAGGAALIAGGRFQ
jgi:hypothetical protein